MFSSIPFFVEFDTACPLKSVIQAFQIYHGCVSTPAYCSYGQRRQQEQHCIFHYTVRGHGEVIYKGVPYITNPGEGFFNIINEQGSGYRYAQEGTEPWEFVVICFKGGNTREAVKELLEKSVIYRVDNTEYFHNMCLQLLEQPHSKMSSLFFPLLTTMLFDESPDAIKISSTFQQIVNRDILKNPTVSAIAAEMDISREHLQREYVRQTGKTPAKYISQKRFEQLCRLLNTELDEDRIAVILHFPTTAEMRLFFKRKTGISIKQYRRQKWLLI